MKFKLGQLEGVKTTSNRNNGGSKYSGGKLATAIFDGMKFVAKLKDKNNTYISIKLDIETKSKAQILYTHPSVAQTISDILPHKRSDMKEDISDGLAILRPNQRIAGKIVGTSFILDMDYVNKESNRYYENYLNKQ